MVAGLYTEINLFCMLILLVFFIKIETSVFMKRRHHLLAVDIVCLSALFIFDLLWALLDGGMIPASIPFNYFVNIGYFTASGVGAFVYYLYCLGIQNSRLVKDRKAVLISSIPCILLIVIACLSPINKALFYIDESNVYHRGPFYISNVIIVYTYFLSTSVISLISAQKKENRSLKNLYYSFAVFALLPLTGVLIQIFLPGYPVSAIAMTLGIFIIYLQILDSQVVVDRLTLLYNRNWFYRNHQVNPLINSVDGSDRNFLLILDIDGLGRINEKYGIVEGDNTLKNVAKVLRKLDKSSTGMGDFTPVRYGDDEFMVICELNSKSDMNMVSDFIHRELTNIQLISNSGYKFDVSIGYAPYKTDITDIQELVDEADNNMFLVKKSKR